MGLHRHGYRSYSQMSRMSMSGSEIAFSEICPVLVESNGKLQILKQETGNFFIFCQKFNASVKPTVGCIPDTEGI